MKQRVARAICVVAMASTCGCALDTSGLLDVADANKGDGDDRDVGAVDGTTGDAVPPADDGGPSTDAPDQVDAGSDVAVDATADAPDAPADAPGDTAVDAPVDASVEALADSGPPPIVWDGGAIPDPPLFDADWVLFCATLAACGQIPSMSACMALLPQPTSPDAVIPPPSLINSVVNGATPNCTSVGRALGNGSACASGIADTCSRNSLVTCRWGFMMTIDCGPLGMVCSSGNSNAGCGFGDCTPAQEGSTYCVGPYYVAQCTRGRYVPLLDCLTFGATCGGPVAAAQCQGIGGMACTGGPMCNGSSIAACMGGVPAYADCAGLYGSSFTCLTTNASVPICAAGTACDPATYMDSCNGGMNHVNYCNAGALGNFNCMSSGWNGCAAGRCTP